MTLEEEWAQAKPNLQQEWDQAGETQVKEQFSGFIRGLRDPVDALSQMLYEAVPEKVRRDVDAFNNWIAEKTGLLEKIPEEGFSELLRQQEAQYQAGREPGFDWARLAGGVATGVVPGVGAARMAAPTTALGKLGAAAGTGALYGTTMPATEEGDFWTQKAAQAGVGAALGPVIPAVPIAAKWGKELAIDPFTKKGLQRISREAVRDIAGPQKEQIAQVLAREGRGTAGQVLTREAGPEELGRQFVRLEQELAKEPLTGGRLTEIFNKQQINRERLINAIAGTDEDMTKALSTRKEISAPMYKMVRESANDVDIRPVVSKIDDLIAGSPRETDITAPLNKIKRDLQKGVKPKELSSLSKSISKMMAKTTDGKKVYNMQVLDEVKGLLDKQIGEAERMYSAAQGAYQKMSTPINRMEVGKELVEALMSPLEKERPGVFAEALRKAPRTIKRATGFPRYKKLEEVLSPEQVSAAERVSAELAEQAKYKSISGRVLSTMETLSQELKFSLPHILSRPIVITNAGLKLLNKDVTPKIKEIVSEMMEDPKKLQAAFELPPTNERAKVAMDLIREASIAATAQPAAREVQ